MSTGAKAKLFLANTLEVVIPELQDQTGTAVTAATVQVTIRNLDGTDVAVVTWPITLSDDGGGAYSGEIPDAADLVEGRTYEVEVVATKDAKVATWREKLRAIRREFDD